MSTSPPGCFLHRITNTSKWNIPLLTPPPAPPHPSTPHPLSPSNLPIRLQPCTEAIRSQAPTQACEQKESCPVWLPLRWKPPSVTLSVATRFSPTVCDKLSRRQAASSTRRELSHRANMQIAIRAKMDAVESEC